MLKETQTTMDPFQMALTMGPVEIACTVVNVLVPGLGSVVNALVEIGKLCMEMKENQNMCVQVEKRFREIYSQLQLMEAKGTLPKMTLSTDTLSCWRSSTCSSRSSTRRT